MAASESRQNEPSKQLGIDVDKTNIVRLQNLSPPEAMRPYLSFLYKWFAYFNVVMLSATQSLVTIIVMTASLF